MEKLAYGPWMYFVNPPAKTSEKRGKWIYSYNFINVEYAAEICEKAVKEHIVEEAKYTKVKPKDKDTGIVCFYLDIDDLEGHKKIITYMLDNNLIQKTKDGRLYNLSFKLNTQTKSEEYGKDFKAELKLSDLIDLNTGKWLF